MTSTQMAGASQKHASRTNEHRLQRKCACGQHTSTGGECEACKKKRLQRRVASQVETTEAPTIVNDVLRSPGQPLDSMTQREMTSHFDQDFSTVRVHTDARSAESARAVNALAYTVGNHIVFGQHQYAPETPAGQRLLAHELTHTVQQRGMSSESATQPIVVGPAHDPLEAEAEHVAQHMPSRSIQAKSVRPHLQFQNDQEALKARLKQVQERLAKLRQQEAKLSDDFSDSVADERQRESVEKGRKDLQKQAHSDAAGNTIWGGRFARDRILKVASISQSGSTVTVLAKFELSYRALSDKDGQKQAAVDIPRIEAAIRDVWQVDIANGEFAGISFRFQPTITYLAKTGKPSENAFQIQVRGKDKEPSSGDSVHGLISLAAAHLEGARVIVVAHELAHLFGFTDTYIQMKTKDKSGKEKEQWSVGRPDPASRPDLLGMIDPDKLARLEKQGAILPSELKRQTGKVRVWEEEANIVLRLLGATPLPPKRPDPTSEDFDPADELERQKREGEGKLGKIRQKRERADNSLKWLDVVEEIMKLEKEEASLKARLGSKP